MKNIAIFLFEASVLKRLQRTGWQILGGENKESVAEHSFMVAIIAYLLAKELGADLDKVLTMSIFHDFSETRTGDIYKLADLYVKPNEEKAEKDSFSAIGNTGKEVINMLTEYKDRKTIESKIVHDADVLALCIELKQLIEHGNKHAKEWFEANGQRLSIKESIDLFEHIEKSDSQKWWKEQRNILHKLDS
jgi:putative hydrolases of HD superfamily